MLQMDIMKDAKFASSCPAVKLPCSFSQRNVTPRTKRTKKASAPPNKEEKPKLTIFEEEVDPDEGLFGPEKDFSSIGPRKKMKENLKLFEDPDLGGVVRLGDSLLLPTACKNREYVLNTGPEEDTEELLRQRKAEPSSTKGEMEKRRCSEQNTGATKSFEIFMVPEWF
ncbi:hcls1-binding protein 3 [Limosa lapponica baueri]|uniref:Hcls1-binding protein 3 n=1 Tax=Limosa lapponica baueri TaxID=1758121 RepID=A0A2I0TX26_LIMLA|nr:hcls1-binding protein 3 [Limosa lapponica baueri]